MSSSLLQIPETLIYLFRGQTFSLSDSKSITCDYFWINILNNSVALHFFWCIKLFLPNKITLHLFSIWDHP